MTDISRTSRLRRGLAGATATAFALTLPFAPAPASSETPTPPGASQDNAPSRTTQVMTRNLYLGADLMPVIGALMTPPSPTDPLKVPNAAAATWGKVQATRPAERMAAIAEEIAEERPDVVGLQEVTTWTSYAFDPARGSGDPTAFSNPTVEFDFLDLLLDALEAEGMSYREVEGATSKNFTSPPIPYTNLPAFPYVTRAIQLADRDVILRRSDVDARNAHHGNFEETVSYTLPGQGQLEVERGWGSVDVHAATMKYRFVNAHLEAFAVPGPDGRPDPAAAEAIRVIQAAELLTAQDAIARTSPPMPIVYVGDYNSEADSPDGLAYQDLVEGIGSDAWSVLNDPGTGFTCCFGSTLMTQTPPLDERIDLVLMDENTSVTDIDVIGEKWQTDRTASGLWPSDHAGVVATLQIDHPSMWDRPGA